MQARDLASPYPTVRVDADGLTAARLLTEHNRPGLIVVDEHDHPVAVLPASQVLRMMIPSYVQDDPTLARVLDEKAADELHEVLKDHSVRDLIPKDRVALPVVAPDDTVLEIAAIMAANRCPLVAVVEEDSRTAPLLGAISASDLLGRVLPPE
jgi:CBS domain-containing protein